LSNIDITMANIDLDPGAHGEPVLLAFATSPNLLVGDLEPVHSGTEGTSEHDEKLDENTSDREQKRGDVSVPAVAPDVSAQEALSVRSSTNTSAAASQIDVEIDPALTTSSKIPSFSQRDPEQSINTMGRNTGLIDKAGELVKERRTNDVKGMDIELRVKEEEGGLLAQKGQEMENSFRNVGFTDSHFAAMSAGRSWIDRSHLDLVYYQSKTAIFCRFCLYVYCVSLHTLRVVTEGVMVQP
jgi:hypothetical protein